MTEEKAKVLVLQGYFQNKKIFSQKTGAFRKIFGKSINFEYLQATHEITGEELADALKVLEDAGGRGEPVPPPSEPMFKWYDAGKEWETAQHYNGISESIEYIRSYFREQKYFDGVVGFSQGGVITSILCCLRNPDSDTIIDHLLHGSPLEPHLSQSMNDNPIVFRFAVLACAFAPTDIDYRDIYSSKPPSCPTLHVFGKGDTLIHAEKSRNLCEKFPRAETLEHEGGHYIPTTGAAKEVFRKFFSPYTKKTDLLSGPIVDAAPPLMSAIGLRDDILSTIGSHTCHKPVSSQGQRFLSLSPIRTKSGVAHTKKRLMRTYATLRHAIAKPTEEAFVEHRKSFGTLIADADSLADDLQNSWTRGEVSVSSPPPMSGVKSFLQRTHTTRRRSKSCEIPREWVSLLASSSPPSPQPSPKVSKRETFNRSFLLGAFNDDIKVRDPSLKDRWCNTDPLRGIEEINFPGSNVLPSGEV
ncbi:hypothetical protein PROFUN_12970 [Planoprotostelium fungivorum]|uniref:Serine hydrolase domain-containing protein n=1 Tax=Planoprotostelium fungivorum TaxID=1890364 RepID=A0A2P6MZI7_9EUKA|nr:hypothetical protein PROFUN_12970 [Planoprotostelium fungivorum]